MGNGNEPIVKRRTADRWHVRWTPALVTLLIMVAAYLVTVGRNYGQMQQIDADQEEQIEAIQDELKVKMSRATAAEQHRAIVDQMEDRLASDAALFNEHIRSAETQMENLRDDLKGVRQGVDDIKNLLMQD